jgi:uncharacterized protein (DUF1778 family)
MSGITGSTLLDRRHQPQRGDAREIEPKRYCSIEPTDPLRWCHTGAMKRMNLRDVPDDVYDTLTRGAEAQHQSLNAFVVSQLAELAQVIDIADYVATYQPPSNTGITLDDAVAAVRDVREAS